MSVAFPLISSGVYGYPKKEALQVAVETIRAFLQDHELTVYLVVFDPSSFQIGQKEYQDIQSFIDDHTVAQARVHDVRRMTSFSGAENETRVIRNPQESSVLTCQDDEDLNTFVSQIDESFTEMLLRKIDEEGMSDAKCYKKANVDRKLFSKIRSDASYKPSKQTALAFAIALKLNEEETQDLLMKAGYALSHSSKADLIIAYYIQHRIYDIDTINEALFAFDQKLLGI